MGRLNEMERDGKPQVSNQFVSLTTKAYAKRRGVVRSRGNSRRCLNLPGEFMGKLFRGCLVALNL